MKKLIFLFCFISFCQPAMSNQIFKIEFESDYRKYSDSDLKRRVWELERAVWQLQQKVFQMEVGRNQQPTASWICKTTGMGEQFSAIGASKSVAEHMVMEKCKASPNTGNGFHCRTPECTQ